MTLHQLEILCRLRAGLGPFHDVSGRRIGAVSRNLERLRRAGFLRFRGRGSRTYALTSSGRAATGHR